MVGSAIARQYSTTDPKVSTNCMMALGLGRLRSCVTIARCAASPWPPWVLLLTALPVHAADALAEARRLYNAGKYDLGGRCGARSDDPRRHGRRRPRRARADSARAVPAARAIPRTSSRRASRCAPPTPVRCITANASNCSIGQAEVLYLDDRFGAAAELFEATLDRSMVLGPVAHERVLDWWATALDRHAQSRPVEERPAIYARILERMSAELRRTAAWRRPATGWSSRRAAPAISSGHGRRRLPAGSGRARHPMAARRCAPISTASSPRRSSRSARPA